MNNKIYIVIGVFLLVVAVFGYVYMQGQSKPSRDAQELEQMKADLEDQSLPNEITGNDELGGLNDDLTQIINGNNSGAPTPSSSGGAISNTNTSSLSQDKTVVKKETPTPAVTPKTSVDISDVANLDTEFNTELNSLLSDINSESSLGDDSSLGNLDSDLSGI